MFPALVKATGAAAQRDAEQGWLWKGRHVKIVDGSTVTLADTPENQAEYPQQTSQVPGAGFPIVRLVVVLSLAVGTVLDYALGPYQGKQTGENQLFRSLLGGLSRGEIVLADRYYASWWDFALLKACGVDLVARLHQHRRADFRTGLRLGKGDHLVFWKKPPRPDWLDPRIFDALPQQLVVREVKVRVECDGFRVREYVVVTTLYDHEVYTAADLAGLYRARWHAELDLRSIKITMQMDRLRCKTPEMARKELAMHLTAYNLIRALIAHAARSHTTLPRVVSFKGALQTVTLFHDRGLLQNPTLETLATLLTAIVTHRVADRPDRIEPRLVKRRPKQYKHLREPRAVARTRLYRRA